MNDQQHTRIRRRDRLRSLASTTSTVIKQELSKYYDPTATTASNSVSSRSMTTNTTNDTSRSDTMVGIPVNDKIQCIIFPTYASKSLDSQQQPVWKVKLCGWTFSLPSSSRMDRWMLAAGRTYGGVSTTSAEYAHFTNLFNQFRCQTMRGIEMALSWTEHNMIEMINSGPSGRFEHVLYLNPNECASRIQNNCLLLEARFAGLNIRPHIGSVDIIDPLGISVISDIDDTIKVTDILDGKDIILQNTFFRKAREIPGMSNVYQSWFAEGAHFHYVSNSPWQVYPALREFLQDNQFPQGSVHLRQVSAQSIFLGKPGKHKLETISAILEDFPQRKFIFVGDSGEMDPEIYSKIYQRYPDQIIKIFIHDVTSERARLADRQAATPSRTDSFYDSIKKFMPGSNDPSLTRVSTSSEMAMDAMLTSEVSAEQQQVMDPNISLKTKMEQFEQRMLRVSNGMRYGVFSVFSLASQLLLDPEVAEELYMSKQVE